MTDIIDQIAKVAEMSDCRTRDQFIYALYLATTLDDLCNCYFNHLDETGTRNEITKHIKVKIEKKGEVIPATFLNRLLSEFKISQKSRRLALGTALKELQTFLSAYQLKEFINCQALSKNTLDTLLSHS